MEFIVTSKVSVGNKEGRGIMLCNLLSCNNRGFFSNVSFTWDVD